MAKFHYRAYDSSGAKFEGEIEAVSKIDALAELKRKALMPSELKEIREQVGGGLFQSKRIGLADLEFLTSELSLLLRSGVRIDKGIEIIRKNKAKPAMAALLNEIGNDLKGGDSLTAAVRKHPKVFHPLYCNLIELGESSGNLAEIFTDLAKDLKFRRELQRKIIGSLMYPAVIFFVCILSILFIFNFIIPRMSTMFEGMEQLPWYTSALLSTSAWMSEYQGMLFLGLLILTGALAYFFRNPAWQHAWQRLALRLPLVRTMTLTVERIRFNSGLALMLSAGLAIDKALGLCIGNLNNLYLRRELEIARDKVKRGGSLSESLRQTSIYPPFFVSLLEVGEESGNLEAVFTEIASRSRQEFESWTERMTTLIEPLMIVFMGGFVGGIVIVMLLSMVSINDIGFRL